MENSRSLRGFVEKLEDATGFQFKLVDSPSSARFFQLYCSDGSEVDVFDEDADRVLLVLDDVRGTREYKIRKSSLAIADTIVSKFVKEHGGSEWEHPSRRAVEIEKRKGYWTESRKSRRKMLGESLTYYVSVPNEEYPHEFHSAIEAKRFMKQHPGSTGEKVRVRSNGEWEPCGEIVLKGRNSVKMSDRNSYAYESRRYRGRILKEMKSIGETVEEYTVKVSYIDLVVFDVKTDEIVYDSSDIHAKDDTIFGFADDVRDEMLHKTFSSYDELGAYTIENLFGLDLNDDKKYLWNDQGDFAEFVAWTDEDCSKSLPSTDPKVKYCWQLTVGYDTQFKESRRRPGRLIKESADNAIKNVFWEVLDLDVNGEDDWEKVEEKEDEDDKTYTSVHQLLDKFKRYGEPEEVVVRRGANIGREIDVDEIDDVLNKPEQYEVNLFIPNGKNREYRVNLFFDVVPNSMIRRTR